MATLDELRSVALECHLCRLAEGRKTVVFGEGDPHAALMVVGEGPGRDEDIQGRPFVGRSGQLLDRLLAEEAGMPRSAVYIANVVKCRPPGNRDPEPDEIAACRPFLDQQVALIDPAVVLSLGRFATSALLKTNEPIGKLRGREFRLGGKAVLVPTFHPAAALRGGGEVLAMMRSDFVRAKEAVRRIRGVAAPGAGVEGAAGGGLAAEEASAAAGASPAEGASATATSLDPAALWS